DRELGVTTVVEDDGVGLILSGADLVGPLRQEPVRVAALKAFLGALTRGGGVGANLRSLGDLLGGGFGRFGEEGRTLFRGDGHDRLRCGRWCASDYTRISKGPRNVNT